MSACECECASACLPRSVWVEFVESTPPTRVDKSFQWRLATTHGSPPLHRGEWIHLICIRLCIVNNFYAYFRLYHERLIGQAIKSHRVWFGKLLTTYLRYNFMPFVRSRQSIIVCHCRTAHTRSLSSPASTNELWHLFNAFRLRRVNDKHFRHYPR